LKLKWTQPVRVLVQVGDAPAHGSLFHETTMADSQMSHDPDGALMKAHLAKIKKLEIAYYFGKINPSTDIVSILLNHNLIYFSENSESVK
jgi:hypothetical protein